MCVFVCVSLLLTRLKLAQTNDASLLITLICVCLYTKTVVYLYISDD